MPSILQCPLKPSLLGLPSSGLPRNCMLPTSLPCVFGLFVFSLNSLGKLIRATGELYTVEPPWTLWIRDTCLGQLVVLIFWIRDTSKSRALWCLLGVPYSEVPTCSDAGTLFFSLPRYYSQWRWVFPTWTWSTVYLSFSPPTVPTSVRPSLGKWYVRLTTDPTVTLIQADPSIDFPPVPNSNCSFPMFSSSQPLSTLSSNCTYIYPNHSLSLSQSLEWNGLPPSLPPSFTQIRPVFEKDLSLPKHNVRSALAEGQSYITSPVLTLYVAGVLATFPKVHIQYVRSAENTAYAIGDVFAIMTPNCLA